MKIFRKIYFPVTAIIIFITLFSCEKNITIDVPKTEEKIVVEGWIDKDDYPIVFLTKNLPYFGTIDSVMIFNMIIQNAIVIVSDGVISDTLQQTFDPNYFPPIFYKGSTFIGEVGKTYSLTIKALGKTLTATTTMPAPVPLDSVWFETEPQLDSLGYLWSLFTDPDEPGNYYRLFTKRQGKDKIFIPILGSTYDDKLFNGQTLPFSMARGISSNTTEVIDTEMGYFKIGDTIILKATSIDKAHYDFWRSAEGEILAGGNPFMNPSLIPSNIVGGGLGVWGGYGCSFYTVIAK